MVKVNIWFRNFEEEEDVMKAKEREITLKKEEKG